MKKQTLIIIGILSFALAGAACTASTNTASTENKPTETKTDSNKPADNSTTSTKPDITKPADSTSTKPSADLAGNYSVNGTGADGKTYKGEMIITNRDQVYQLSWKVGNERYDGVGVQSGNTIAAAYTTGNDGTGCGAVVYKIGAGDSLEGKWGEWGVNQSGTEKATASGKLNGDTGTFDVTGTNANGTAYKGKLNVSKSGNDVYQFSWDTGTKYIGTGVKMGEYLAAGSGSKQCGFVIYEVKGANLEGKWGVPGSTALGTEKAMKN